MGKQKYQVGDLINNKAGLSFKVEKITILPSGTKGRSKTQYHATCSTCGHNTATIAGGHEKRKFCPGCEKKPAALKTDDAGNCVTICRMGQLEYIHKLITEENMTQQGAVESFIEAVHAHANEGDPLTYELTVEMVRSQYRRDSGKLTERPQKSLVESTKKTTDRSREESPDRSKNNIRYKCLATVAGVQCFLDEHLPNYKVVPKDV